VIKCTLFLRTHGIRINNYKIVSIVNITHILFLRFTYLVSVPTKDWILSTFISVESIIVKLVDYLVLDFKKML